MFSALLLPYFFRYGNCHQLPSGGPPMFAEYIRHFFLLSIWTIIHYALVSLFMCSDIKLVYSKYVAFFSFYFVIQINLNINGDPICFLMKKFCNSLVSKMWLLQFTIFFFVIWNLANGNRQYFKRKKILSYNFINKPFLFYVNSNLCKKKNKSILYLI